MIKGFTILLLAAAFASCRSTRTIPPEVIIKDSIVERTTIEYRDTTIYRPGEKVKVIVPLPCPDAPVEDTKMREGNTALTIERRSNELHITCETDSLKVVIDSLKTVLREKEQYNRKTIVQTVTQTQIVTKMPRWVWYLIGVNALYILWRFRNPIVSLFKSLARL